MGNKIKIKSYDKNCMHDKINAVKTHNNVWANVSQQSICAIDVAFIRILNYLRHKLSDACGREKAI